MTSPRTPQRPRRSGILGRPAPVSPVVQGPEARVQWWERGRALVGLSLMVLALGMALAAVIGALFFLAGFFLEQLVAG